MSQFVTYQNFTEAELAAQARNIAIQGARVLHNCYCDVQDATREGDASKLAIVLRAMRAARENFRDDVREYNEVYGTRNDPQNGHAGFDLNAARAEIHARMARWQDASGG